MGYERKEIQILGGGFNLLPPRDKVPIQDYLLAQNWRPDREGKLEPRWGFYGHHTIPGAGVITSAALGRIPYWADAGGNVYAHLNTTPIASGFAAARVGMVAMNDWMWFMNRGASGRHSETAGYKPWGLQAPTSALAAAAGADLTDGPSGTYQLYVTFEAADGSVESNIGPVSAAVTVASQAIDLTNIPTSPDSQVGVRNIYATGGTLGQGYLVLTINDNVTTTGTLLGSDLAVTQVGIPMPRTNDAPPEASGIVGPYFGRLFAFSSFFHLNRLWWTDPGKPQYWPGADDPAVGNWADVGADGEAIVWCTVHTNILVIYKERSIWRLVGDPDSGTLEQVDSSIGLVNADCVANAGQVDYFVGPQGLYRNDLDRVMEVSGALRPLFQTNTANAGALTPPGALPEGSLPGRSSSRYAAALGFAMGKLYVGYIDSGGPVLLVLSEKTGKWFYYRTGMAMSAFGGFLFDGQQMLALTGDGSAGKAYDVDDFSHFIAHDDGAAIECVYQSHFEDCGAPDNEKVWLEVAVDCELAGDTAKVYAGYEDGKVALAELGTITGTGRQTAHFELGADGVWAKNISIAIELTATHAGAAIHNVYLYYYVEARLGVAAATIPLDLGSPRVKECKELQLDIDASGGPVDVNVYSDLPGNALAVRHTPQVAKMTGRAPLKFPFAVTEGFLWRLALSGGPFRLYAARLLMRAIGTYIEAYEAKAGFVWDSMEMGFEAGLTHLSREFATNLAGLPIKRAREIMLQIDTAAGDVTLKLLTDLPGNTQAVRITKTVNTGTAGRRPVRIPLPAGTEYPIEGRIYRLQLLGTSKFILYAAALEILPVGVYVEAYEAAAGAVYDSREVDFGTPAVKEARELALDIETDGEVTVTVLSDISEPFTTTVSTSGREVVPIPLTVDAATGRFVEGRLLRVIISGAHAFALYGARILARAFGLYLTAGEAAGGAFWDSTELDLGTSKVKQLRELALDIWAYGAYTVRVYTDLPGNAMSCRVVSNQAATAGRRPVMIPLLQGGVPDNTWYGRLVRVTIESAAAFKLFGARVDARPIGVYIETYEAADGAVWDSTPHDLGSPNDKYFDQVRFEMDSDGPAWVNVYTDLPGESFALRAAPVLTPGATSRHWATAPLPAGIEGRSIRVVVVSGAGFRIYRAQVRSGRVGRYLAAATPGGQDALNTLEFDFSSERVKACRRVEVDLRADGAATLDIWTDQTGTPAKVYSTSLTTSGRQPLRVALPPGVRGRLVRIALSSASAARIYKLRVWARPLNEPGAVWGWLDYPLEESDVLPAWADLPVEATPAAFSPVDLPVPATPPDWKWADFPVTPTEAQWFWAQCLTVESTPEQFEWVDVPFEVTG